MKKKYDIVLFDADRTLYDFDRGEENALRTHMTSLGIDLTEEMYGAYKKINKSLILLSEKIRDLYFVSQKEIK